MKSRTIKSINKLLILSLDMGKEVKEHYTEAGALVYTLPGFRYFPEFSERSTSGPTLENLQKWAESEIEREEKEEEENRKAAQFSGNMAKIGDKFLRCSSDAAQKIKRALEMIYNYSPDFALELSKDISRELLRFTENAEKLAESEALGVYDRGLISFSIDTDTNTFIHEMRHFLQDKRGLLQGKAYHSDRKKEWKNRRVEKDAETFTENVCNKNGQYYIITTAGRLELFTK